MPNPAQNTAEYRGLGCTNDIEAPEVVQQNGNTNNWHQAIGTGPFILTDFVSGGSATMVRNPTYWELTNAIRRISFLMWAKLQVLVIPQAATALAAVRAGKISIMGGCHGRRPRRCSQQTRKLHR